MTDTKLLRDVIAKSGLKINFIAETVGISRAALYRKINNAVPFNQFEIEKLCSVLPIKTLKEKEAIFFAKDVDK